MRLLTLLTLIFFINLPASSQNEGEIWIKGKIIEQEEGNAIPNAQIASYKEFVLYAADEKGCFSIVLQKNDSIRVLSMGFHPVVINLENLTDSAAANLKIVLKRASIMLKEVNIYQQTPNEHLAEYMPSDIKMGYKSDVPIGLRVDLGEKPNVFTAVFKPTDFIYYHLSKKEKRKRKTLKIFDQEKIQNRIDKDLIAEISGFQDDKLNDLLIYCNSVIKLSRHDSEETIRIKILDAISEFITKKESKALISNSGNNDKKQEQ